MSLSHIASRIAVTDHNAEVFKGIVDKLNKFQKKLFGQKTQINFEKAEEDIKSLKAMIESLGVRHMTDPQLSRMIREQHDKIMDMTHALDRKVRNDRFYDGKKELAQIISETKKFADLSDHLDESHDKNNQELKQVQSQATTSKAVIDREISKEKDPANEEKLNTLAKNFKSLSALAESMIVRRNKYYNEYDVSEANPVLKDSQAEAKRTFKDSVPVHYPPLAKMKKFLYQACSDAEAILKGAKSVRPSDPTDGTEYEDQGRNPLLHKYNIEGALSSYSGAADFLLAAVSAFAASLNHASVMMSGTMFKPDEKLELESSDTDIEKAGKERPSNQTNYRIDKEYDKSGKSVGETDED
jgi:hypothetical protein